jgi:iron complex transport system permease protein
VTAGASPLSPRRLGLVLLLLLTLLFLSGTLALMAGPSWLPPREVLRILLGVATSSEAGLPAGDIVLRIRLPLLLLGGIVGASLSVSGVLFQALLRNPLADPFVLGVSGGAALGGIVVLGFGGVLGLGYAAVPPAAFLGSIVTALLLFAVAGARGRLSSTSLLLTGVVFNAIASAAIVFVASLSGLSEGTSIFLWLIGSLSAARESSTLLCALFLLAGLAVVWPQARRLDLLALGEESATQLGVDVERVKRILLAATSLMVGAAVSVSGLIGFVGLIIPHFLRLLLGPDHRLLVPASALGGAIFLVLCDTAARTVLASGELPVGAITALAGGPLFLFLLRRQQGKSLLP